MKRLLLTLLFLFAFMIAISPSNAQADFNCPKTTDNNPPSDTNCPVCPSGYQFSTLNGGQCDWANFPNPNPITFEFTCTATVDCTKYPGTSCILRPTEKVNGNVMNGCCNSSTGSCITDSSTPVGSQPVEPPPQSHVGQACILASPGSENLTGSCPTGGYQCVADNTGPNKGTCMKVDGSISVGQSGCSFKLDGTYTQIIACKNDGFCAPTQYGKTITSTTPNTYENGICVDANQCPICNQGYQINFKTGKCTSINDPSAPETQPSSTPCPTGGCNIGVSCSGGSSDSQVLSRCPKGVCDTALGPLQTDLSKLLTQIFSIVLAIAGVAALGLIIASGYRLMVSQGNPEQVKGAREQLTAAIIGLLFIVFSLVILQVIGANILKIPGFN